MRALTIGSMFFALVALAAGGKVELTVGTQKVITEPSVARIAINDPAIVDVKTIGNNQLLVIGLAPGKTTIEIWKSSGNHVSYVVTVLRDAPAVADAGVKTVP